MEWYFLGIWMVGLGIFVDVGFLLVMDGSCVIGFFICFKNLLLNISVVD